MEEAIQELQQFGVAIVADKGGQVVPARPQELVSHGSTLLAALAEMAKHPIRSSLDRLRYRHLAFLDTLRAAPRSFGVLDAMLA